MAEEARTNASLAEAEARGFRFRVRHQPGAEGEDPDWAVVVETPEGRLLFPPAIDVDEASARRRALALVASIGDLEQPR